MTYDKVQIGFLMTIFSVSLTSIILAQSFADENNLSPEQIRQEAINKQMNLTSKNAKLVEKIPIEGFDRIISQKDHDPN